MNNLIAFDGHNLNLLMLDGRPAIMARQVGAALGYSDNGGRFADQITDEWSNELADGVDYKMATHAELSASMAKTASHAALSPRGALVLFESGIYLACLLSRKEAGRRLRRKLADDILPQLTRDGRYDPTRQVTPAGDLQAAPARDELTDLRQRLDLAQGLIERLPEERRAQATEAMLRLVLPGLALPEPQPVAVVSPPPASAPAPVAVAAPPPPLGAELRELFRDWLMAQPSPVYTGRAARALFGRGRPITTTEIEQVKALLIENGYVRVKGSNSRGKAIYQWWKASEQPQQAGRAAQWPAGLPQDWKKMAAVFPLPWTEEQIEMDRLWWEHRLATQFIRRRPGRKLLGKRWGLSETPTRTILVRWGWTRS